MLYLYGHISMDRCLSYISGVNQEELSGSCFLVLRVLPYSSQVLRFLPETFPSARSCLDSGRQQVQVTPVPLLSWSGNASIHITLRRYLKLRSNNGGPNCTKMALQGPGAAKTRREISAPDHLGIMLKAVQNVVAQRG